MMNTGPIKFATGLTFVRGAGATGAQTALRKSARVAAGPFC